MAFATFPEFICLLNSFVSSKNSFCFVQIRFSVVHGFKKFVKFSIYPDL